MAKYNLFSLGGRAEGKEEKGGDKTHNDAAARKAMVEGRARPWYVRMANNNATTNQQQEQQMRAVVVVAIATAATTAPMVAAGVVKTTATICQQ